MIFSLACEGLHPEDAYQVESLLAFMIQVGGRSWGMTKLYLVDPLQVTSPTHQKQGFGLFEPMLCRA
jgi:hypothetical protein